MDEVRRRSGPGTDDAQLDSPDARFECLFAALYGTLCDQAHRVLRDASRAEDAVQDVFAAIWRRRAELLSESSSRTEVIDRLSGYLRVAVRNRCRALLAREMTAARHAAAELAGERGVSVSATPQATDGELVAGDLHARLDRAIAALPPQQRVVLLLRRFDGMSTAEVAEQLGLSVKTVENHLGRALQRLAAAIRE